MRQLTPPATLYRMGRGGEARFAVVRTLQEHPEDWVLELRSIHPPHVRVEVVVPRESLPGRTG